MSHWTDYNEVSSCIGGHKGIGGGDVLCGIVGLFSNFVCNVNESAILSQSTGGGGAIYNLRVSSLIIQRVTLSSCGDPPVRNGNRNGIAKSGESQYIRSAFCVM